MMQKNTRKTAVLLLAAAFPSCFGDFYPIDPDTGEITISPYESVTSTLLGKKRVVKEVIQTENFKVLHQLLDDELRVTGIEFDRNKPMNMFNQYHHKIFISYMKKELGVRIIDDTYRQSIAHDADLNALSNGFSRVYAYNDKDSFLLLKLLAQKGFISSEFYDAFMGKIDPNYGIEDIKEPEGN